MGEDASHNAAAALSAEVDRRTQSEQALARTVDRITRQQRAAAELAPAEELLSGDVEGLARKITEKAADAIGCERVNVWLFDETETVLKCVDHYARSVDEHLAGLELHESEYSNEFAALRNAKFVDANDALTDPRTAGYVDTYLKPLHITSMLDTVIDVSGRRLGLICFEHVDTPHVWTPDEISFAGQMADKLGLALMSRLRLRSEEASRQSDRRFRTIFNSVSDAIFTHDLETGAIVDVNDRACDLYGYSHAELLAGDIGMLSSGQEPYTQAGALQRIVATTPAEPNLFEWQCRTRGGRVFWGEVGLRQVRFGDRRMVLATVRDIDERKQAEQKLQLANSLLTSEIESAPDGVLLVATDPVHASYNRKFASMWGLSEGAAGYADPDLVLARVGDSLADAAAFRADILRFRQHSDVPLHRELELRDGRILECHVESMRSAVGKPLGRISFFRDITARRRAERELAYANTLLKTAMETSQDAILVVDPEGRIASFNERFVEMWNLSRALADAGDDAPVLAAVTAQVCDPERFVARIKDLYAHPQTQANDEIFTIDGRVVERHSAGLLAGENQNLGRVWFFRDVTEARHAAASLREERDFVAALLANLPAFFALIDESGRVIRWNENLVALLGPVEERPWNRDVVSVIDERQRAAVREVIRRAFTVGHTAIEVNVEAHDGSKRTIQVTGQMIVREGRSYLLVVGVDVTEARKAERSLRESEARFRSIFGSVNDGIVVHDVQTGAFLDANPRICEMFGYSRDEMLRLTMADLSADDPPYTAAAAEALFARAVEGEAVLVEWSCRARDGHRFWIEISTRRARFGEHEVLLSTVRDVTERRQTIEALTYRDRLLHAVTLSAAELVSSSSLEGSMPHALAIAAEALGVERVTVHASSAVGVEADVLRAGHSASTLVVPILGGGVYRGHIAIEDGKRERDWSSVEIDALGMLAEVIGALTLREQAGQSLVESEQRFRAVSETALDAIVMIGKEGRVQYWNRAAERILGYTAAEASDRRINEWLRLRPFALAPNGAVQLPPFMSEGLAGGATLELVATRKDGVEIPIELAVNPMVLGAERHAVGVLRDITERKRNEAEIARLARFDALTGLPNRRVFVEALQQAIARVERGGPGFAVLYLDLDHFKDVNDTLGHPVGDRLLQTIAHRLQSTIRDTDTVARFGGDEFALIEADIKEGMDAAALAAKLISAVNEPLMVDGNEIRSATSVGIAIYGADSVDAETLLSHADVALYRAKAEGRGTYRFFTDAMDAEVRARVLVAAELREALASQQLFLVYQPQVELATGRIIGLEALVRWRHPKRGIVCPSEFIHIAERSGLIVPLGRWVLQEACAQQRAWADAGIAPPLVAVNVSGQQFKTPLELEETLDTMLAESGLAASQLELEITESVLMEASRDHNDVLVQLREKGVRIAIDDFGNGYSSLDYLRRFHVDRIKIAQNFIADLGGATGSAPIVKAALGLARELGIEVVVEGVETAEQVALLEAWGSRAVQGHYFAPPLPPDLIAAFLESGTIEPAAAVTV